MREGTPHCRFDPEMQCVMRARRPISGSEGKPNLPEPRLKFVLMLMDRNLKILLRSLRLLFNCLPDATSIKSTRPARPNCAVKLTLLTIRGRASQRDTAAPRCPGNFSARQRQRAVTSPGETTADATRNACACSCISITFPASS